VSLKKFVAPNAREALKAVRLELGDDAVVLANKRVPGGVEITAMAGEAIDAVVELATAAAPARPAAPAPAAKVAAEPLTSFIRRTATAPAAPTAQADSTAAFLRERAERLAEREAAEAAEAAAKAKAAKPAKIAAPAPAIHIPAAPAADARVMDELAAMKAMLADQLAAFAWTDATRKNPLKSRLTGEMLGAGFSPALARGVMERLPNDFGDAEARKWMAAALTRNLACFGEGTFLDEGGVFALVGPTGVGKTTTTAKLAARYAMRYGAKNVGLITTDSYRIGAHDQLKIYGRILGIPVQLARGGTLATLVESMRDKKVVLIDTVGVGQRDSRVPELMAELEAARAKRVLLLNASAQGETLDEVVRIYRPLGISGAIVSKIDEAAKLGGALDVAIRHRLPLAFITNGQRVPEDLHAAQSAFLVHRALRAASTPDFVLRDEEQGIVFSRAARTAPQAAHAA
jgi:flagellar biosynthesis protein FlhF